ncbi:MAG: hypothetical protein ACOCP8_03090 [archaeon]
MNDQNNEKNINFEELEFMKKYYNLLKSKNTNDIGKRYFDQIKVLNIKKLINRHILL